MKRIKHFLFNKYNTQIQMVNIDQKLANIMESNRNKYRDVHLLQVRVDVA